MYELIIFAVLLVLGYVFGQAAEKKHFASIRTREQELKDILVFNERFPGFLDPAPDTQLVSGNVVISVDFFKSFVAGLRTLVGGRITSYESLLERARREAILRMKAQASDLGGTQIFNIKIETASISNNASQGIGSVEVYAYGTAVIPQKTAQPSARTGS